MTCPDTQTLEENPSLFASKFKTMCGASVTLRSITNSLLHGGNLEIKILVVFPDLIMETVSFTYPGFNQVLRKGYMFTVNGANLSLKTCSLTVATEASQNCIPEGQGTLQDTRPCCQGLIKNPTMGVCEPADEPPPDDGDGDSDDNTIIYVSAVTALLVGGYLILRRK